MIISARDLKVRGVLCALRFVHVVDLSMSHGGRAECGMPTAPGPGLPLSVTLTGVCDSVDFASPSIKRILNICQGTIDDAVGLFQNITNAYMSTQREVFEGQTTTRRAKRGGLWKGGPGVTPRKFSKTCIANGAI